MSSHSITPRQRELADKMLDHLLSPGGEDASFRALAAAAGVSRPTLVHHFGDRAGALRACIRLAGLRGRMWVDHVRAMDGPPSEVVPEVCRLMVQGWRDGQLKRLHRLGFLTGLLYDRLGDAYLEAILEPTLGVLEELFARYHASGALVVSDPRAAALRTFSPVLVALLHQDELGGQRARPLDVDRFVHDHVLATLVAYQPPQGSPGP